MTWAGGIFGATNLILAFAAFGKQTATDVPEMKSAGISCVLALQLTLAPLGAQPPTDPTAPAGELKLVIVSGEGVINNIRQRTAREMILQVNDEKGNPVEGATVSLTVPSQGASGTFSNGSGSVTVVADSRGQASIRGFRPNTVAGKFELAVVASYRGQSVRATVTQFNMAVQSATRKSGRGKTVAIVAVVVAAAAGGAYAGLRQKGSTPAPAPAPTPSVTLTPGTGTVGAPN
jgi:hypothetical protein